MINGWEIGNICMATGEIHFMKTAKKIRAVSNSTSVYRKEMGPLHEAHFPRKHSQLKTGMLRYHGINVLQ